MLVIERGFRGTTDLVDSHGVDAVEVFTLPVGDPFRHVGIGTMGSQETPDYWRDLFVFPSDEQKYVSVGRAVLLERGLQSLPVVDVDTYVDRQAKPDRGRLDCRERPNVVIQLPGILLRM